MVLEVKEKLIFLVKAALEKKATLLVVLDVRFLSSYTDYIVICNGTSTRHVQAIAEYVEEILGKEKIEPLGIEGLQMANWVLMDYNDIVLHIFNEPARKFYDLEGLYPEAPRYTLPGEEGTIKELEGSLFAS